mmetsp:Transcript_29082/g.44988  ORF Transcript_29082/g.44988 Transcript_29082/m.44988 type:complete len:201 (-) Transcript_29082:113-715(-)
MFSTKILIASKATSSYCKNAYKDGKRKLVQFQYDDLAPSGTILLPQRHRYDHRYYKRLPRYNAGVGVKMSRKYLTLRSRHCGVMSIRRSVVNDSYKWVEMDYDIHKVYCTNFMHNYYRNRNQFLHYHPDNRDVRQEYHIMRWMNADRPYDAFTEPECITRWHQNIQRDPHPLELYQDPNILSKCPENSSGPIVRREFAWD